MMDSDLQHPPEFINSLVEKFQEGYEIVNTKEFSQKTLAF